MKHLLPTLQAINASWVRRQHDACRVTLCSGSLRAQWSRSRRQGSWWRRTTVKLFPSSPTPATRRRRRRSLEPGSRPQWACRPAGTDPEAGGPQGSPTGRWMRSPGTFWTDRSQSCVHGLLGRWGTGGHAGSRSGWPRVISGDLRDWYGVLTRGWDWLGA